MSRTLVFKKEVEWAGTANLRQGFSQLEVTAVKWWLEKLRFTPLRTTKGPHRSVHARQTTFVEMAILLETQTNLQLGGPKADLARKVALLRGILRYLMSHGDPREGKVKTNFDKFFDPRKYVSSLEPQIGTRSHGIWRCFQRTQGRAQVDFVVAQLHRAQVHFEEKHKK